MLGGLPDKYQTMILGIVKSGTELTEQTMLKEYYSRGIPDLGLDRVD